MSTEAIRADFERRRQVEHDVACGRRFATLWGQAVTAFDQGDITPRELRRAARLRDRWNPTWDPIASYAERGIEMREAGFERGLHTARMVGASLGNFGDTLAAQWKERESVLEGVSEAHAHAVRAVDCLWTMAKGTQAWEPDVEQQVFLRKEAIASLRKALKALGAGW